MLNIAEIPVILEELRREGVKVTLSKDGQMLLTGERRQAEAAAGRLSGIKEAFRLALIEWLEIEALYRQGEESLKMLAELEAQGIIFSVAADGSLKAKADDMQPDSVWRRIKDNETELAAAWVERDERRAIQEAEGVCQAVQS